MVWDYTAAKITLPILAVTALLGTFKLGFDNGFIGQIQTIQTASSPYLPGSVYPLKSQWTGLGPIDRLAVQFIAFFWPVLSGQNPSFSLQGIHFLGQGYAIWTLLMVESYRIGNAWRAVSFITITGLLMENLLMALTLPVYCFLHLLTSPTVVPPPAEAPTRPLGSALLVHPSELALLPYSIALGAGLPTLGVLLSPAGSTAQQTFLVLRQIHPILTTAIQFTMSLTIGKLFPNSSIGNQTSFGTPHQRNRFVLRALQKVYSFATTIAVVSHVGVVSLIVASQTTTSVLNTGYRAYFTPNAVFQPPTKLLDASSSSHRPVPFAAGAHVFLQYDEVFSTAAIIVWALAVNRQGVLSTRGGMAREGGWTGYLAVRWMMMGWLVVGGPAAVAIKLVEERDNWLLVEERDEVRRGLAVAGEKKER